MFVLDIGTLYQQPDGRSWIELWSGCQVSCIIVLAFRLTTCVWRSVSEDWAVPDILAACLMTFESL